MMKIEEVVFWILIALIVGVAIWKLIGSPTDTAALISIAMFIAASEILIWKTLFKIDKSTAIGFAKVRNELSNFKNNLNNLENNFGSMDNNVNKRLENIENLIKKKR